SGSRAGVAAALVFALYTPAVFYTGMVLDVSLALFTVTALGWASMRAWERGRAADWMVTGMVGAAAMLFKPFVLLFAAGLPCGIVLWRRKAFLKSLGAYALGVFVVLAPFAAKNALLGGVVSPFPLHSRLDFYMGNHTGASGGPE
ncbi:MAG: glycosyltransferase family 39 protein, partial [Candidatus Omnitrophica bacterium]|nr:glycosyltransferase family 39 protein [Candidatus Omnitrophota bacterium]